MKNRVVITFQKAACLAICLVSILTVASYAVPVSQVYRSFNKQSITGMCCQVIDPTVTITEPAKMVPVIVTWSTDYQLRPGIAIEIGVSINGGACQLLGGGSIEEPESYAIEFNHRTFQFTVYPTAGLQPGQNEITVCGGGFTATDFVQFGYNVLEARISN